MPGKLKPSLVGLTAAVTIPLVVLAILATVGIRAQKIAARSRVQEEASAVSASQARLLSQQLKAAIRNIPQFPDPPVPGSSSRLDDILDGTDGEELKRVRDDPEAGLSPAGLPRRALAALRLEALSPNEQNRVDLVQLLSSEAASVLTLSFFQRLQERDPDFQIPEAWQLIENFDQVNSDHPNGGWISLKKQVWWISPDGKRFLPPSALSTDALDLPPFAEARISSNGKRLSGPITGEVLASTPIEFPSPLALEWILTSPEVIASSNRQQTRWTLALLATSLLVSACGIYAIFRMVRHERRLHDLKGHFVSSVSHELRAPLGSIRLMAEALEEERVESPNQFHRLIGRESERLAHLIENVLDFARIEEGGRDYHFEETDLAALIRDAIDLNTPRAVDSGHTFKPALETGTAFVDRPALQQAISNLLDNALKFSPPSTTIDVTLKYGESTWTLAVSDEGPGVPESEKQHIFERFYRLGDENRRKTKGAGIGLSIVEHLVRAHGGRVSVTNHPTTFTLGAPTHPPTES